MEKELEEMIWAKFCRRKRRRFYRLFKPEADVLVKLMGFCIILLSVLVPITKTSEQISTIDMWYGKNNNNNNLLSLENTNDYLVDEREFWPLPRGKRESLSDQPGALVEKSTNSNVDYNVNMTQERLNDILKLAQITKDYQSEREFWEPVMLLDSLIYILGICGNLFVLVTILGIKKYTTVTDVYILNLAIADLTFISGLLPLIITMELDAWIFGQPMCKIYMTLTSLNQFASSLFLVGMSYDRYLAVCHPVYSQSFRKPKKAKIICCEIWAVCLVLMTPILIYSKVDDIQSCSIAWPDDLNFNVFKAFTYYSFILGFLTPVVLIAIFYCCVMRKLRSRSQAKKARLNAHAMRSVPTSVQLADANGTAGGQLSSGSGLAAAAAAASISTASCTNKTVTVIEVNGKLNTYSSRRAKREKNRRVGIMVVAIICVYIVCWLPYWYCQMAIVESTDFTQSANYSSPTSADFNLTLINQASNDTSTLRLLTNGSSVPEVSKKVVELDRYKHLSNQELKKFINDSPMPSSFYNMFTIATSLSYLNSCLNPILYAFLCDDFRKLFWGFFNRKKGRNRRDRRSRKARSSRLQQQAP